MQIVKPQLKVTPNSQELERLKSSPVRDGWHRNMDGSLIKNDLTNTKQILMGMLQPFGLRVIRYNDFAQQIEILNRGQLQIGSFTIQPGTLNDDFTNALISFADSKFSYQLRPDIAYRAVNDLAHENHYNPLKEYLDSAYLKWDTQPHIASFMAKWLGVEQSEINVRMFTIWLIEAATKVYQPTAKADYALLLQGGQGVGKTTFFEKIAVRSDWYTDSVTDFKDKDNWAIMLSAWIVNDDEMKASKHTGAQETKSFISARELQYRAPYERTSRKFAKNFVIGMTTNDPHPLKDYTGNRRYFVLHPNAGKRQADITDPQLQTQLDLEVTQLWGETMAKYHSHYSMILTKTESEQIASLQDDYLVKDDVSDCLDELLDGTVVGAHFSIQELLGQVIGRMKQDYLKPKERKDIRNEIAMIMENKPDWQAAKWNNKQGYTRMKV
ncbi:virulence-associated E family protein [Oenococcus sp.]|uniref:virulence-associated E family protein n=1 Tax=Oenococcus sp. TaxID=1979414 RepID=UPI0039E989DE